MDNTISWTWTTVTNPGGYFSGDVTRVPGVALLGGSNTFSVAFASPGTKQWWQ